MISIIKHIFFAFILVLIIPLVWFIFLDWTPLDLISGGDVAINLPWLKAFSTGHGIRNNLMNYFLMGGAPLHDFVGIRRFYHISSLFVVDLIWQLNLYVFVYQALFAYWSLSLVIEINRRHQKTLGQAEKMALWCFFAFLPIVSWRITMGHTSPETVLLPAMFFVLLKISTKNINILQFILLTFSIYISTPFAGQIGPYLCLFAGPFFCFLCVYLYKESPQPQKFVILGLMLLVYVIAIASTGVDSFYNLLKYATSTDANRNLADTTGVIYSYTTQNILDMFGSLFNRGNIIQTRENHFLLHETNYPVGPIALFAIYCMEKKHRLLLGAFVTVAVIAVIISMNIHPFSDVVLSLIGILNSFRVPARSLMILLLLAIPPLLGLAWRKLSVLNGRKLTYLSAVAFGIIIFATVYLNDLYSEVLAWIVVCGLIILNIFRIIIPGNMIFLSVYLAIISLQGFRDRIEPYAFNQKTISSANSLASFFKQNGSSKNKLARYYYFKQIQGMGGNDGMILDTPTISGYWFAPRRYLELVTAINQEEYISTLLFLNPRMESSSFPILQALYNISFLVDLNPASIKKIDSIGAAWFPQKIVRVNNWIDLANNLRLNKNQILSYVKNNGLILESDSKTVNLSIVNDQNEISDIIEITEQSEKGPEVRLRFNKFLPKKMIMAVSLNYLEFLSVYAIAEDGLRPLQTFPIYGALLGVLVEKNVREVLIVPERETPRWIKIIGIISTIIVILIFVGYLLWWSIFEKFGHLNENKRDFR